MIEELIRDSSQGLTLAESTVYEKAHLDEPTAQAVRRAVEAARDFSGYHLLMALRRERPEIYLQVPDTIKAEVLSSALGHVKWLNDWGYLDPGGSWDDVSAQALVATGWVAASRLRELLDDQRPAPLSGSEMAFLSSHYGYRRCDFAFRYLSLILGVDPAFQPDPALRDTNIAELRSRLVEVNGGIG